MSEEEKKKRWPRFYYAKEEELYDRRFRRCSPNKAKRFGTKAMRTWKGNFDKSLTRESYAKLYDIT